MQQLYYVKKRTLEWRDVPAPVLLASGDALVRPIAAARCDLDNAFLLRDMTPALRIGLALHMLDPLVKDTLGLPAFQGGRSPTVTSASPRSLSWAATFPAFRLATS
jgi:hypothetical protein